MDATLPDRSHDRLERVLVAITAAWLSFFASWTVLAHAIVFGGGGFDALVRWSWTAPIAGAALAFALMRRWSASSASGESTSSAGDRPHEIASKSSFAARLQPWSVALSIACVIVGVFARYEFFWWLSLVSLALSLRPFEPSSASGDESSANSSYAAFSLLVLALAITAITACAHRANIDDAGYVNLAVGALDHPDWPLLRYDTLHGIDGVGILLPTYRVHSFELLGAWIAELSGVEPLRVFHLVLPFVFTPLSVVAFALLYRRLLPSRWLAATWLTIALLLVLGQKPVAYGNFAYVRLFQGKALLATIAIPLVVWSALRWQREGSARSWAWLFVAEIVAVGITANAMYVAPLASGLVLAASWRPDVAATKRLVLGVLASSYPLVFALYFVVTHQVSGSIERQETRLFAADLTGVVGTGWQRAILFAGLVCAGAVASRASTRQFWTRYAALVLLLPLNPYVSELWARYVTGRFNWRLLWAVALVPMAAVVIVETCARLPRWASATIAALAIGFVVWHWDQTTLSVANGVEWRTPSLKVDRADYAVAREMVETAGGDDSALGGAVESVRDGVADSARDSAVESVHSGAAQSVVGGTPDSVRGRVVLAPESIAAWIVTFRHHPFPLVVRPHYLTYMIGKVPGLELKERRALFEYATGESRDATSAQLFAAALRDRDIAIVAVQESEFEWKPELERILTEAHYSRAHRESADLWLRAARPKPR